MLSILFLLFLFWRIVDFIDVVRFVDFVDFVRFIKFVNVIRFVDFALIFRLDRFLTILVVDYFWFFFAASSYNIIFVDFRRFWLTGLRILAILAILFFF